MYHYEKAIGLTEDFFFWKKDDSSDERSALWEKQRQVFGFDERETWGLNIVIAAFVYPRLKMFAENTNSVPLGMTLTEWRGILGKMERAFEMILTDYAETHCEEVEEGLDLFRKYFFNLWD